MKTYMMGIPIYRFYYDKVDEIHDKFKKLNWIRQESNYIWEGVVDDGKTGSDLHKLPQFQEFFGWIHECLAEVSKDMGMQNKLKVNSAWANLNKKGDKFHLHNHNNCFVSSNYYVSGSPRDKTVWYKPNPYFETSNIYPCGDYDDSTKYELVHEEPTEPGKYIVFHPTIVHESTPNTSNEDRITMACDDFPDGLINKGATSRLNVRLL